ncbi:hypothetical protein OC846_006017 [Tilletia horrida]|uniref:GH16 domain-containing protein n=1 Tax=Tilletia horrida TaxID=155126 RepID=A0AAN6JVF4_9BASI|nr:hypothetical protein OC845_005791 [Tilletia horrida]KAK0544583.1 hypothetical protein OC846_006017 [Tilletia horrida]KAK0560766.1 hypothetical protein OC861_006140 [Tilletia horrida]
MSELPYHQGEAVTFRGSGMAPASRRNTLPTEDTTSARKVAFDRIEEEEQDTQLSGQQTEYDVTSPPRSNSLPSNPAATPEGSLSSASPFGDAHQVQAYQLGAAARSRSSHSVQSHSSSVINRFSPRQPSQRADGHNSPSAGSHHPLHQPDGPSRRPRSNIVPGSPLHSGGSTTTSSSSSNSGSMREAMPTRPTLGLFQPAFSNPFQAGAVGEGMRLRSRAAVPSTVLPEGHIVPKPWLESKTRRSADRRAFWLLIGASLLGVAAVGALVATQILSLPKSEPHCLILDENFDGDSINPAIWQHEIQTGGFGNHEFEWTTDSTNNSYVKDGLLHIIPTLTSDAYGEDAITNGGLLNLTASGKCTAAVMDDASCAVASNSSLGTVLPPIQSARLTTNLSKTIKYGRIEVRARMPTGDWIWPAIWMMPKNSVYGPWPASGEIDIFESTGNVPKKRSQDGVSKMTSTLHWGPTTDLDRYWMTSVGRKLLRNFYNSDFHVFGLEWDEEGIWTWEHSRAYRVLSVKFTNGFWATGNFPPTSPTNSSAVSDPWGSAFARGSKAALFDQDFYLILNVAVGGTNGYFPDSDNKPWSNSGRNPRADFWATRSKWLPTWPTEPERRGMVVDYVSGTVNVVL